MTARWAKRFMTPRGLVAAGLMVATCCSACERSASPPSAVTPPILFYGKVIDQAGQPIAGAEVDYQLSKLEHNPIIAGGLVADRLPQNRATVQSGVDGGFVIQVLHPNHILTIEAVMKGGYHWVIDWAWSLSVPPHNDGDNREFSLPSKMSRLPMYQPDAARPAIFPLHRDGDPSPATQPSRGGSDRMPDGTIAPNHPTKLRVPSTGPGAPQTNDAINSHIRRYAEAVNAGRTSGSSGGER